MKRSDGISGIDIMDNGIDSESLHQPAELFSRHGTKFVRGSGPCKVAGFYAFVKKQETISFFGNRGVNFGRYSIESEFNNGRIRVNRAIRAIRAN